MLDLGSERLFCDMRGDDRPGAPDGMKVRRRGQRVLHRAGWYLGHHARGRAHRHDPDACGQHGLGRRRLDDAVLHRADHAASHPTQYSGDPRSERRSGYEAQQRAHPDNPRRQPGAAAQILEAILTRPAASATRRGGLRSNWCATAFAGRAKQAEVGIDIPSDGEYSKPNFLGYVTERLAGSDDRNRSRRRRRR